MQKRFLTYAGISGAIAVTLGAMGAHFLKAKVSEGIITSENLESFKTGVNYQMYHTLALLALTFVKSNNSKHFIYAMNLFLFGILLFSGSIYILSLKPLFNINGLTWLGPVTPIGGLCFIAGWIFIFTGALKSKNTNNEL